MLRKIPCILRIALVAAFVWALKHLPRRRPHGHLVATVALVAVYRMVS